MEKDIEILEDTIKSLRERKAENNKGRSQVLDYGEHVLHSSYSFMFHFH